MLYEVIIDHNGSKSIGIPVRKGRDHDPGLVGLEFCVNDQRGLATELFPVNDRLDNTAMSDQGRHFAIFVDAAAHIGIPHGSVAVVESNLSNIVQNGVEGRQGLRKRTHFKSPLGVCLDIGIIGRTAAKSMGIPERKGAFRPPVPVYAGVILKIEESL